MLSRTKRALIVIDCMKRLHPLCVKRKNLFPEKDAEDLMEEVGVYMWICLLRYRNKPYNEASKLAFITGKNRLTSIVRSRMTVVKRGSKVKFVPGNSDDLQWMSSKGIYSNGTQIVEALEAIVTTAVMKIGVSKSNDLVRALLYDWHDRKPVSEQVAIMNRLGRTRKEVRILVDEFTDEIRRRIHSSRDESMHNPVRKVDGKWKSS